MAESTSPQTFELFSSLRYDPILLESAENSSEQLSFNPASPFYMLIYHRDRMLEAAHYFGWDSVVEQLQDGQALEGTLISEVEKYQAENGGAKAPLKLRVLFTRTGDLKVELGPVPPVPLTALYPRSLSTSARSAPAKEFNPSPLTGGALSLGPTDSLPSSTSQPPLWALHIDSQSTSATPHTSLKTTNRAQYDSSRARTLPASPQDGAIHEVMLFNTCDEMTEGSATSLYFYRGGQWVTPPVGATPTSVPGADDNQQEAPADAGTIAKSVAESAVENANDGEGDHLPSFPGRWGHSIRSSTKWPDSGGQRGTTRRWALRAGLSMEEIVERNSVTTGELVWVSNGVRGFHLGKVVG